MQIEETKYCIQDMSQGLKKIRYKYYGSHVTGEIFRIFDNRIVDVYNKYNDKWQQVPLFQSLRSNPFRSCLITKRQAGRLINKQRSVYKLVKKLCR